MINLHSQQRTIQVKYNFSLYFFEMFNALEDIKLETVDFNWIKETTKISHLKRAIRLIENDGNYFAELKNACYDRIGELDPTQKRVVVDNRMMPEVKAQIDKQLEEWEKQVRNQGLGTEINLVKNQQSTEFDPQIYFQNNRKGGDNRKRAENEKVKGNQSIKSKDYQQAIKYYTKSIELDSSMHQSFGNRALAYIKLKEFQKALNDCQEALKIDPKYTKAYHRKSMALKGIKNRVQAYKALQQALKIQPDNSQINADLKGLREQMNEEQLKQLEGESKFKKITIEEDSEDQEDEEIKEN